MTVETTYTQEREQLKALMDRAVDDREVIVIQRRSGDAVAMIAAEELQSLLETAHLLRSPRTPSACLQRWPGLVQRICRRCRLRSWRRMSALKAEIKRLAVFQPEFVEDLSYWVETERRTAKRLLDLVKAELRDPFKGIGNPEPLKYLGSDVWSRRITHEHRCVYLVKADRVEFLQSRYHY